MPVGWDDQTEWLETDGLGGFASGTVGGIRTRRYHGLLVTAPRQPAQRVMLVNGLEVFVTTAAGRFSLSSQRYDGQVIFPEGYRNIESFQTEPWPTWRFRLPDGTRIEQQLCMRDGKSAVAITWRLISPSADARLEVRPLLSGRDFHALHVENERFSFDSSLAMDTVTWQPYPAHPQIVARSNGAYHHDPVWYRKFFYQEEWLRGFKASEDLGSPGTFTWQLAGTDAALILSAGVFDAVPGDALTTARRIMRKESERRGQFAAPLERAADQYLVRRGTGKTIIAGYPWFGDWGRNSFISLRGICLARHRYEDARAILIEWAKYVSEGMLPNRFPDAGEQPEYNSVDAALWYVIAVQEFLSAAGRKSFHLSADDRHILESAIESILLAYSAGTRFGIRADTDGLLTAGEPGSQLTWMDARVNGRYITPRVGKPVEVQALWINALWTAGASKQRWHDLCSTAYASFRQRFWNPRTGGLHDVIDCDHHAGAVDSTFRPNQIFAVGGLPLVLLEPAHAQSVVDQVEQRLWTTMGLRSLAPDEPGFVPQYCGEPEQRDGAYHQGTVWPWLIGPFAEAWVRSRGGTDTAKLEARRRFIDPLIRHQSISGLGHVSEIADAQPPHMPRGCPFQAWSVSELLRVQTVLAVAPKLKITKDNSVAQSIQPPALTGHPICG